MQRFDFGNLCDCADWLIHHALEGKAADYGIRYFLLHWRGIDCGDVDFQRRGYGCPAVFQEDSHRSGGCLRSADYDRLRPRFGCHLLRFELDFTFEYFEAGINSL